MCDHAYKDCGERQKLLNEWKELSRKNKYIVELDSYMRLQELNKHGELEYYMDDKQLIGLEHECWRLFRFHKDLSREDGRTNIEKLVYTNNEIRSWRPCDLYKFTKDIKMFFQHSKCKRLRELFYDQSTSLVHWEVQPGKHSSPELIARKDSDEDSEISEGQIIWEKNR